MFQDDFKPSDEFDPCKNFFADSELVALEEERLPDDFWVSYDPFEPYDAFGPYEEETSYDKWKRECKEKEAKQDQENGSNKITPNGPKCGCKEQLSESTLGVPVPLDIKTVEPVKIPLVEQYQMMYQQQISTSKTSWFFCALRLLACLVLAVALYCFCNGYQEVRFLEIVNKCLEGHHNPMCEGFMEPENTMNDYKPITVQEDMYADRLEWIPKQMTPSEEYSTLVSILERHPCQSLRCLDKLTAQIYGGDTKVTYANNNIKRNGKDLMAKPSRMFHQKPEFEDKIDDVLKQMGKLGNEVNELKAEVQRKNKEYLSIHGSTAEPYTFFSRNGAQDLMQKQIRERDAELRVVKLFPEDTPPRVPLSTLDKSSELHDKADEIKGKGIHNNSFDSSHVVSREQPAECATVVVSRRFDCHPAEGANEQKCLARGCCWQPLSQRVEKRTKSNIRSPYINPPFCFYPPSYTSYQVIHHQDTPTGQEALLQLLQPSGYEGDYTELRLQLVYETETRLKIQIGPSTGPEPWQPVLPLTGESRAPLSAVRGPQKQQQYRVTLSQHNAAISVIRLSTNTTLFSNLGAAPLVFAKQFVQLSSLLASSYVYGLGQHLDGLLLDVAWTRYTLWNADQLPVPGANLYGSHPFYMVMEESGDCHGVFLLSTLAMSVVAQPAPAVTFTTTGGGVSLYVLTGPSPAAVVQQYVELVGKPSMPPYWALGYHQCRFGYLSLNETKKVWQRTRDAGIPFDVQWNDLDYMADRNDFTIDDQMFAGLPQFVDELHKIGMRYVPIIDPGISGSEPPGSYPPYDEGASMGIFVRNASDQFFIGKVWNRVSTVWPDFSHPRALYYWARQFVRFHGLVPFDGAWIDMNEPSNFLSGAVDGCNASNSLNEPPYLPPGLVGGKLYYKTLCGDAKHYVQRHYSVHNLYANLEAVATNVALKVTRGERPLVISRASFPGLGVWGGHWTGDVISDWANLRASIPDVLNFNLFGIPLVGADICGFNGNTTASLCLRWMQLGAFYPFSRNHNSDDTIDQDPVAMGEAVVVASRNALNERYKLLPYLYTLFYFASVRGDTVARPLFVQFPSDLATFSISSQFLWGSGLMIVPALQQNVSSVEAYLPCGSIWYDWYTGERVSDDYEEVVQTRSFSAEDDEFIPVPSEDSSNEEAPRIEKNVVEFDTGASKVGQRLSRRILDRLVDPYHYEARQDNRPPAPFITSPAPSLRSLTPGCHYVTLAAPEDRIPLLVRGGAVLPLHPPGPNTESVRDAPYSLLVALDQHGTALGHLFVDDGISIDTVGSGVYTLLQFRADGRKLVLSSDHAGYKGELSLDVVTVLGVLGVVESVTINGEPRNFTHDPNTQVLRVPDLKWTLPLYFVMKW